MKRFFQFGTLIIVLLLEIWGFYTLVDDGAFWIVEEAVHGVVTYHGPLQEIVQLLFAKMDWASIIADEGLHQWLVNLMLEEGIVLLYGILALTLVVGMILIFQDMCYDHKLKKIRRYLTCVAQGQQAEEPKELKGTGTALKEKLAMAAKRNLLNEESIDADEAGENTGMEIADKCDETAAESEIKEKANPETDLKVEQEESTHGND